VLVGVGVVGVVVVLHCPSLPERWDHLGCLYIYTALIQTAAIMTGPSPHQRLGLVLVCVLCVLAPQSGEAASDAVTVDLLSGTLSGGIDVNLNGIVT